MKNIYKKVIVSALTAFALSCSNNKDNLEEIVLNKTPENQVVMFGERHGGCRLDNDFVANLLPELKEQGFEYLALETDMNPLSDENGTNRLRKLMSDYALNKLKRKNLTPLDFFFEKNFSSGWFDLIDAAQEQGYKIICYDPNQAERPSFREREKRAFENIKKQIFDKDPEAKVIIFCGSDHLNEIQVKNYSYDKGKEVRFLGYHMKNYKETLTVNLAHPIILHRYLNIPFKCDLSFNLKEKTYVLE